VDDLMFLTELTLDQTYEPRTIQCRLTPTGRLDTIKNLMVKRLICQALGEYMRDVVGTQTTGPRPSFTYVVSERHLNEVVALFQTELDDYL
jgi:hypothetical protein